MLAQLTLYSERLDMSCHVAVAGPQKLTGQNPLKVVYVLHGLTGNEMNWIQYTQLPLWVREGNTLFILPCAARSWYTDAEYGQRYFTYVSCELPELCGQLFDISHKREDTSVMGNSMGGYGALKCAFSYPERYGMCWAFSPAGLYWDEYLEMPNCCELQNEFRGIFGHELRVQEKDRLPNLAGKASLTAKMPIVRMTCGTSDFLLNQNRRFAKEMRTLIPDFQYEEWEGAHDWTFWNQSLERMLHEFGC